MAELLETVERSQSRGPRPDRLQKATFETAKSWKGRPVGPTIDVIAKPYLDDTGYHPLLSQGDSYLVFAYKGDNGNALHIPVGCASDYSLMETADKIRVLDALTRTPGTG